MGNSADPRGAQSEPIGFAAGGLEAKRSEERQLRKFARNAPTIGYIVKLSRLSLPRPVDENCQSVQRNRRTENCELNAC